MTTYNTDILKPLSQSFETVEKNDKKITITNSDDARDIIHQIHKKYMYHTMPVDCIYELTEKIIDAFMDRGSIEEDQIYEIAGGECPIYTSDINDIFNQLHHHIGQDVIDEQGSFDNFDNFKTAVCAYILEKIALEVFSYLQEKTDNK